MKQKKEEKIQKLLDSLTTREIIRELRKARLRKTVMPISLFMFRYI